MKIVSALALACILCFLALLASNTHAVLGEVCWQVRDEPCADCVNIPEEVNSCIFPHAATCGFSGTCTAGKCDCEVVVYLTNLTHKVAFRTPFVGTSDWNLDPENATTCAILDTCEEDCEMGSCVSDKPAGEPFVE